MRRGGGSSDSALAAQSQQQSTEDAQVGLASEEDSDLDYKNLADGSYTVSMQMVQVNMSDTSMSNAAIVGDKDANGKHVIRIDVESGVYTVNVEFQGLSISGTYGYLGVLNYYTDGWTRNSYGSPTGSVKQVTVLTRQKDADGNDVYDYYNTADSVGYSPAFLDDTGLYPAKMQFPIVSTSLNDESSCVALQVKVPVMGAIATSSGTQDVYMQIDWTTLASAEADKTALASAIETAKAVKQGKKTDKAYAELQSAIATAQAVADDTAALQSAVDAAVTTLNAAVEAFNATADEEKGTDGNPYNLTKGTYYKLSGGTSSNNIKIVEASDGTTDRGNGLPFSTNVMGANMRYNEDGTYTFNLYSTSAIKVNSLSAASTNDESKASAGVVSGTGLLFGSSAVTYYAVTVDSVADGLYLFIDFTHTAQGVETDYTDTIEHVVLTPNSDGGLTQATKALTFQLYPVIQEAKAVEQGKKTDEAYTELQSAIAAAEAHLGSSSDTSVAPDGTTQAQVDAAVATLEEAIEAFNESADKVVNPLGLEVGRLYSVGGITGKGVSVTDANGKSKANSPFSISTLYVKLRSDGKYDLRIYCYTNVVTSLKGSNVDDEEQATEGTLSTVNYYGSNHYSMIVDDITKPIYLWVDYTNKSGTKEYTGEKRILTLPSEASSYEKFANIDVSELWVVKHEADAITGLGDRTDSAWPAFYNARSKAAWILQGYRFDADGNKTKVGIKVDVANALTEEEISAAAAELRAAIDAFNSAEKQQGAHTWLLEEGAWYTCSSSSYSVYDEDGSECSGDALTDFPLWYGNNLRRNADGSFDFELWAQTTGKFRIPTKVQYRTSDDGEWQEASVCRVGVGYEGYRLVLGEIEADMEISLLVSYADTDGTQVDDEPYTIKFDGLFGSANFGFTAANYGNSSDLYLVIAEAKELQEAYEAASYDEQKSKHAYGELQVCEAAASIVYWAFEEGESGTQEELDAAAAKLAAGLAAYEAAPLQMNIDELASAIEDASDVKQGKKSDAAFTRLMDAMETAQGVSDAAEGQTDEALVAAKDSLLEAIDAFNSAPDVSGMTRAVTNAQARLDAGTSKPDSAREALASAIAEAKAVANDLDVSQSELDAAVQVLGWAVQDFITTANLDFSALEDAIAAAESALGSSAKTDAAGAALQAAIDAAKEGLAAGDQDSVDAAEAAMGSALDAFEGSVDAKAKDALDAAIVSAQDALAAKPSKDESAKQALSDAIAAAQKTASDEGITTEGAESGAQALSDAIAAFDSKYWERLSGDGRYNTMQAIVQEGFDSADTVVIASGDNFPDALSATSLAGAYDAPILLTSMDSLNSETASEIKRLGASKAIIVGGPSVISDDVLGQVADLVGGEDNVDRVYGADRYATNLEVNGALFDALEATSADAPTTAIIATGTKAADALAISSFAYSSASPIYLVGEDGNLSDAAWSALAAGGYERILILGGASAVSSQTETQCEGICGNVKRLAGDGRVQTSYDIASYLVGTGELSYDKMAIAYAWNYPDALCASALCGKTGSVIVLCDDSTKDSLTELIDDSQDAIVNGGYSLGGTGVVSADTHNSVRAIFGQAEE